MVFKGKNRFGEDVFADADGSRQVRKDGVEMGAISGSTGFDPFNTTNSRYRTVLEEIELACRNAEGGGIGAVGAIAAVRAMARHWDDHLGEGHSLAILATDIEEVKAWLDRLAADINRELGLPKV